MITIRRFSDWGFEGEAIKLAQIIFIKMEKCTVGSIEKISSLLRPRSIAVVGATQDTTKIINTLMSSLMECGYLGKIFPVNPRYTEIGGLRCYPSLADVPDDIEHCIIAVPQEHVLNVIRDCRKKGIPTATILSAGYAELGAEGVAAQTALREASEDMVFIGPNCIGFANLVDRVVATSSATMRHDSRPGDVAVISQSGGLATSSFAYFGQQNGFTFSYIVTTGNSAGISYGDLTEFLFDDSSTKIIVAIIEDERLLAELIAVVRQKGLIKPIVLIKCGRGRTGTRMAQSHTGSLAGDYAVARDVSQQLGIVCADDIEDGIAAVSLLKSGMLPEDAEGLSAISVSGGNLTLFADAVDDQNLCFADLTDATTACLRKLLPDYVPIQNPVDVTTFGVRDVDAYAEVLDVLLDDPGIKTVIMIITVSGNNAPILDLILGHKKSRPNSRLVILWNGGNYGDDDAQQMRQAGVPVFYSARTLVRALDHLRRTRLSESTIESEQPTVFPKSFNKKELTESESLHFLATAGLPTPRIAVSKKADLENTAEIVGYPIVIKADAVETHLSDRGAVILDIRDVADLTRMKERIANLPGDQVVVSQFLPGNELVVSTFKHPTLGPVLMVGSGGLLVELMKDVRFCALPATRAQLKRCLEETLIGSGLKSSFRGAQGFEAALDFLVRLASISLFFSEFVAQIEINPITVGAHGAVAVDATVIPVVPARVSKV